MAACGAFYDDVVDDRVRVRPQPDLDRSVGDAVRQPVGNAFRWGQEGDSTPLWAATLAHAGHLAPVAEDGPSVYEERGMVSL